MKKLNDFKLVTRLIAMSIAFGIGIYFVNSTLTDFKMHKAQRIEAIDESIKRNQNFSQDSITKHEHNKKIKNNGTLSIDFDKTKQDAKGVEILESEPEIERAVSLKMKVLRTFDEKAEYFSKLSSLDLIHRSKSILMEKYDLQGGYFNDKNV